MNILIYFLPIIWASVATAIGLILYKSSKALFESNDNNPQGTRRIRFVGSAAIAGGAFLAMKIATPGALLVAIPDDSFLVKRAELTELTRSGQRLEEQLLRLESCLATESAVSCRSQLTQMSSTTRELAIDLDRALQAGERDVKTAAVLP